MPTARHALLALWPVLLLVSACHPGRVGAANAVAPAGGDPAPGGDTDPTPGGDTDPTPGGDADPTPGCDPNPCVAAHRGVCTPASPAPRCDCDPGFVLAGDTCVAAGTGTCGANPGQLFPATAPWNTPIDAAPLDDESGTIVGWLAAHHTDALRFQIAFDFNLLTVDASTPHRAFTPTGDYYDPDCDPAPPPVPLGGRLEGEVDYACAQDGDCHLTVIDAPECRLYEMWRADIIGGSATGTFRGGCQAIWDLSSVPPPTERGDYCTSADAAGLPIAPLVFSPDEIFAGHIDHAVRFILPNELIRARMFVRPGTHSTSSTSGPEQAPPYSARLRLKASTDLSRFSASARVVARALQKYGMFLADGGRVTFTATTDALTTHTWDEVGLDGLALTGLGWNDFEVVELGARIDWTLGSCERTPITQ